jgi:uncharacterized protein (DUF2141 family)
MKFPREWHAMTKTTAVVAAALAAIGLATTAPAIAQYRQVMRNDMRPCADAAGPAMLVTVNGVRASTGRIRVQAYRATADDWLQKGRWLSRIEEPARAGTMTFCVPLPAAGSYGIAVRHDANGNGETDLRADGGGMSNNPSINIFNLGRPSYTRTAVPVSNTVRPIQIQMRYL